MSGGRIPREFIDDLLVRVDIVDLIDSHIPLKKTGSNYTACCPFHNEKTPSFSVNRNKQFYHCFGCSAGGNAISFLMAFNNLDFVEAVEDLAHFVGLEVPRENSTGNFAPKQSYNELYTILEQVAVYYLQQLKQHPQGEQAIQYLQQRGVSGEIARDFSLGYAPNEWDALASRFDKQLLINAGMLSTNDNGQSYDRFRGRLIFPIRDKRNRVIGFGGRVLDNSQPKYLNSPETPVFSKGRELYGLYELLKKQAKPDCILVVEGYMDVITLAQFGVNYAVAVLGTSLSKIHLDLLFRFSSQIVFCFDGDSAGQRATWRAVEEAFPSLKDGREIKIMQLPEKEDPDTFIRNQGREQFEQKIHQAQALSDYFFYQLCYPLDLSTAEGQAQLLRKAQPFIEQIPGGFFREIMQTKLSSLAQKRPLAISLNPTTMSRVSRVVKPMSSMKLSPERVVIALLLQKPQLIEIIDDYQPDWGVLNFPSKALLLDIMKTIEQQGVDTTARLMEFYRDTDNEKILSKLVSLQVIPPQQQGFDEVAEFKGALKRVIQQGKKHYFADLLNQQLKKG